MCKGLLVRFCDCSCDKGEFGDEEPTGTIKAFVVEQHMNALVTDTAISFECMLLLKVLNRRRMNCNRLIYGTMKEGRSETFAFIVDAEDHFGVILVFHV